MSEFSYSYTNPGSKSVSGIDNVNGYDDKNLSLIKKVVLPIAITTVFSPIFQNDIYMNKRAETSYYSSISARETHDIPTIFSNERTKTYVIDIGKLTQDNKDRMLLMKEANEMYKNILDNIIIFEKVGMFFGVLFALFFVTLPLYTAVNFFLSFGAASSSSIVSIFLYKLFRGMHK